MLEEKNFFDQNYKKVLDLGSADGFWTLEFAKKGSVVTAIDNNSMEGTVERFRFVMYTYEVEDRVTFILGNVETAEFGENYDLVLFMCLYHHLDSESVEKVLDKIHTALNKGGTLLVEGAALEGMEDLLLRHNFKTVGNFKWPDKEETREVWKAIKV